MWVKKEHLEPYMEEWTDSKLGNEQDRAIYCHPVYLTYMQSTSCEILDWMKHKHNNLRYAHDSTVMAEIEEELKNLLMKMKEKNEKAGLKLNIQNTKIMASGPLFHGK